MTMRLSFFLVRILAFLILFCTSLSWNFWTPAEAQEKLTRYGIYLTQLGDFNAKTKSFSATFWLFTSQPGKDEKIFSSLEFTNSTQFAVTNYSEEQIPDRGYWYQERIRGTFRHDWDISRYPFNRQVLRIEIQGSEDIDRLIIKPDIFNSGFDPDIRLDGWQITSFQVIDKRKAYTSSFGDPRLAPGSKSEYGQVVLEIVVEQTDVSAFLTMIITPIISMLLALFTYLLMSEQIALLTTRLNLLAGSIFAIVISMRSVAGELGSITSINLVDVVHIAAILYVTSAICDAIYCWWLIERNSVPFAIAKTRSNIIAIASSVLVAIVLLIFFIRSYVQSLV